MAIKIIADTNTEMAQGLTSDEWIIVQQIARHFKINQTFTIQLTNDAIEIIVQESQIAGPVNEFLCHLKQSHVQILH
jgi:hypothetical protein